MLDEELEYEDGTAEVEEEMEGEMEEEEENVEEVGENLDQEDENVEEEEEEEEELVDDEDEENNGIGEHRGMPHDLDDGYCVDSFEDIARIEFWNLGVDQIYRFHFGNLETEFEFYNTYAKVRGFSARKSKTRKNSKGKVVKKIFVCFREGYRPEKYFSRQNRRREPRAVTRCGCNACFEVRFVPDSGRWHVAYFSEDHNHECLEPRFVGMLPAHRKMSEAEIGQMNTMLKAGISTSHIYRLLANQCGGYEHVGFVSRDMYNEIAKRRRCLVGDAKSALRYLECEQAKDGVLYFNYEEYPDGMLRHLFWCDGRSQQDYELFGDVIAFDATYKKNKYECPLVVFSGVNHHNQTIVFASALVSDERDETYIWLLEQFLIAMKEKAPVSVITDGDRAMRKAICTVWPDTHHRLCAWHLIRNATSNIGNPRFTAKFKNVMLGDYEVSVFCRKWFELVEEFGVQDKPWIIDMYEKRHLWATAHIRGKFFAGFRTTSRCEGFHSVIARYVKSKYNLSEFLENFQSCVGYMRFKEIGADFDSARGVLVMQTCLEPLERFAANVYSRTVFGLFHLFLVRARIMKVLDSKEAGSYITYVVCKYGKPNDEWHVDFCEEEMMFKCSCLRMESFGIPCEHIVAVLVYRDICELSKSLVLHRWTKQAKAAIHDGGGFSWDSLVNCQYAALMECCKQMAVAAAPKTERFHESRDLVLGLFAAYTVEDEAE